jgi:tetratricopeptide (TPR) repeat protein
MRAPVAISLLTLISCHSSAGTAGAAAPPLPHATVSAPAEKPVQPLAVCNPGERSALEAARAAYDAEHYGEALSCAAEATAELPDDPDAQSEKAAALSALGKYDEAQTAYAHALAVQPNHLDALLGVAHLFAVSLPSTRERDELAKVYSEKGLSLARAQKNRSLEAQFSLLSAMAFNDLGDAKTALGRAEVALRFDPKDHDAQYERALALFELDRFGDAKVAFVALEQDPEHRAHALYHLGLLLEREGAWKKAAADLAEANRLAPADFPRPVTMSAKDFRSAVTAAIAGLPSDMRRDLKGVPVASEDIPTNDDLLGGDPPLSPTILGIYRGPPIGESCLPEDGNPCRSVALYRLNLARATSSRAEMIEQIRVTLLHEVGHLRGEDDQQLAARGLE